MKAGWVPEGFAAWVLAAAATAGPGPELWVYARANFQVRESTDEVVTLMGRARRAGYDAVVLGDFKFGKLEGRPPHYYVNLKRVRETGERVGLEIIPAVMPIGYSNALLANDPNLAEGIPVRNCVLEVKDGRAGVYASGNLLPGGEFESGDGRGPEGWLWVDGFGKSAFLDENVWHGGGRSLRMADFRRGNEHGNCRAVRLVDVKPWHQYRITLWIRTRGLSNPDSVRVVAMSLGGRRLNFTSLGVKADQDWQQHDVLVNSLDCGQMRVYAGIWSGRTGTLWLDDVSMQCVAGVNMLRRAGCPLRVTSVDGRMEYEEGTDFERWEHAGMGRKPWPGEYEVVHPEPPLKLTPQSRIREGQRLLVSFYHTVVIHDGQVAGCLSHPEVFRHLRRQIELIHEHWAPRRYFMSHDEIRVAGQCESCRAGRKTCGELLADNVRECVGIIKRVNPEAGVVVWSDMFDPHHNARDDYYLAGSTFKGSWAGLDPAVGIANWNHGHRRESYAFFAGRGHGQVIAGYYDHPNVKAGITGWRTAVEGLPRPAAFMYTTWRGDYGRLEEFATAVREAGF